MRKPWCMCIIHLFITHAPTEILTTLPILELSANLEPETEEYFVSLVANHGWISYEQDMICSRFDLGYCGPMFTTATSYI